MDPEAFAAGHAAGDHLVVAVNNGGPAVHVRLAGELDMATVDELTETVEQICQSDQRQVILDLSNLEFCDACGLTAILAVQRRLKTLGGSMTLVGARPVLHRMVTITGLEAVLDLNGQVSH